MLQALKTPHNRNEQVLLMKEFGRYIQFRRTKRQTVRHEIFLGRPCFDTFLLSSLVHGGWTYSGTFVCLVTNFFIISICNAIWSPGMLCSERATQSVNWGSELKEEWNKGGWGLALGLGWAPGRSSSSAWLPPVFQCCEKEKLGERKRKGEKKRKGKKGKKKTHAAGLPKSMGRKENQKIRFKKKNGMSHNRKKKKRCREVWTEDQTEPHSYRKRRGEEKGR